MRRPTNDFTVDYRSDLVYDWYGICSVCKELLMKCLVPLNLGNYKDIAKPGKRIISRRGYATITVHPYNANELSIEIGAVGWTVKAFLEQHDEVYIISEI